MCGIVGLFGAHSIFPEPAQALGVLSRMMESLGHRGPDGAGRWVDSHGRCLLGHRRLSIIDTSEAGQQPMTSGDCRWVITFNGEIYNFEELRPRLADEGIAVRGRTDTEVLLESIALWGVNALEKLDGMFAFAAFNVETGELLLARDPFGEKPLYYIELPGGGLAFASELQALEMVPGFDPEVSADAVAELLMFQYVGAPRTIYRSVKKLPPGHWLSAQPGQAIRTGRYFEFLPGAKGFTDRTLPDLADELEDILVRSVRRRLISDVPLGAFLSGGVDSSTVCALVRQRLGLPLKTFSIGFKGTAQSEHEAARTFAAHLGTEHHDQLLAPDTSEFLLGIGKVLDEPNADSSCMPTYLLSQYARRFVTVALSGDGGDEMFGGYGRYFLTLDEDQAHAESGRGFWHPGRAYYGGRILISNIQHVQDLVGPVPDDLAAHLYRLREEVNQPSPPLHCRLRKTDVDNYMPGAVLPKVDRMSMQHSLEVRTPFLNVELVRFAERLPLPALYREGRGKLVLRELAYRYLPRDLVDAPKQGFGIPATRWGKRDLLRVAARLLGGADSRLRASVGAAAVDRLLARQRSRIGFSTYELWGVCVLESWLRHHPARLSELTAAREKTRTRAGTAVKSCSAGLYAYALEPEVFAVVEEHDRWLLETPASGSVGKEAPRRASDLLLRMQLQKRLAAEVDLPSEAGGRARDAGGQANLGGAGEGMPHSAEEPGADGPPRQLAMVIPGWGQPVTQADRAGLTRLRGGTLLFPSTDASQTIGWSEVEKFRSLGVRELWFVHPYRFDGALLRMRLNLASFWRRVLGVLKLRRNAIALPKLQTRGRMRRFVTRLSPALEGPPGTELSQRYMVFEGLRQLPPVPTSPEDIVSLGSGRYAIESRKCVFSGTRWYRYWINPYWIVEKTPATIPHLLTVPELIGVSGDDGLGFVERLERRIAALDAGSRRQDPDFVGPGAKVVVLTHALPPGGAERQWVYLATGLKRSGYDVSFVSIEPLSEANAHYLPLLRSYGIEPLEVTSQGRDEIMNGIPGDPETLALLDPSICPFGNRLAGLTSLLCRLRPQVVFAQLDHPNLMGAIAGLLAGVGRIVMSFRNLNPSNFSYLDNDWYQPCYRAICRASQIHLAGNSREGNRDYAEWIGIPGARVAYIANAIDASALKMPAPEECDSLRGELRLPAGLPVILGVFRLSEEKQPLLFLDVCAALARRIPGLRVLVAGVGPLRPIIEKRIKQLGLTNAVALLGRRNDVPALMTISTLMLHTSSIEGMPNAIMEAQFFGLPIVATRAGGTQDCVVDGATGYLLECGDGAGLVEACATLLRDEDLRRAMGRAAADHMRSRFSLDQMTQAYTDLLDSPTESESPSIKGLLAHADAAGLRAC